MRKIGELKGKPIVEGNPNEIKNNQIHIKTEGGGITLSERKNGNLETISGGSSGKEGNKLYYYYLDFSKFQGNSPYLFGWLKSLSVNNFNIPGLGKGNYIFIVRGSSSEGYTWADIVNQFASSSSGGFNNFPPVYFALNETSEVCFNVTGINTNVILKGNIIEQFKSLSVVLEEPEFLSSLYPTFTEITEEEYLAL
jgi:hypothetical protein